MDDERMLEQLETIAVAIGRMFPDLCEVVLHDLRTPEHAVRAIENPISGRRVGDAATPLGLARIADPEFADTVQNYPNTFPDGRPSKSTSIGIRGSDGSYIAALCLNLDVSVLTPAAQVLGALVGTVGRSPFESEPLDGRMRPELRRRVETYAMERGATPRGMTRECKRELVRELRREGRFELRGSSDEIATLLGISRATVYAYAKEAG